MNRIFGGAARKSLARSTHRKAKTAYFAAQALLSHAMKQWRLGNKLAAHCEGKRGLLLNVGCGNLVAEGWVNIDYSPVHDNVFYHDALDPFPIADGTVQHVHCEHFFEYFELEDAIVFLKECHRVLVPEGILRIIVPDAERYMRAYSAGDDQFFAQLQNLGGALRPLWPKAVVCNHAFRMDGAHQFAWDFETLDYHARQIGFSATRSRHNDVAPAYAIDGQDWWRPFESLFANLVKLDNLGQLKVADRQHG